MKVKMEYKEMIFFCNKKFWEEQLSTFLDTTRATLKTTRPTILLLLRVYLLSP
jgi:hypothetical protein